MVEISIDADVWRTARSHLEQSAERVGFFLADWSPVDRCFAVRGWRPIDDEPAGTPDDMHVELADATLNAVIKWASTEDGCLIEAHSHGRWSPAAFSPFDLQGFVDWVPHLWWRLRQRPYAAIVTSRLDFDALAWIDGPTAVERVSGIRAKGFLAATGATRLSTTQE